jgi:hypothetical protein
MSRLLMILLLFLVSCSNLAYKKADSMRLECKQLFIRPAWSLSVVLDRKEEQVYFACDDAISSCMYKCLNESFECSRKHAEALAACNAYARILQKKIKH